MAFRDVLKEKVPEHLQQTPEFPIILKMIADANITGAESFRHWLNVEIQKCKNELKEEGKSGSTMNRKRVQCAKRIELLTLVQDKILSYLL